jgi:hypothetical protein
MGLLDRWRKRREWRRQVNEAIKNGKLPQFHRERRGTFVSDAEFHRTEELRVDRLGPSEEDVPDHAPPDDPWRPQRSLGRINWS